jgi:2,3,4,5-tetrahydropyridine-2-carboxylate N-succinyltransferase
MSRGRRGSGEAGKPRVIERRGRHRAKPVSSVEELRAAIERYGNTVPPREEAEARAAFESLKAGLNAGVIRAAERGADGRWRANAWVKSGILLGFRLGRLVPAAPGSPFPFYDKDTYPIRPLEASDGVRVVPGGSAIRDGSYVAPGVVCMPPMYINVGAYVGEGTLVDSHALVGSCAQIGRRVHISAAAQIGGVLEPVGALPVIIEDDVTVGGNCGVYEGTIVRERAVLAPGTILSGGTPVFDLVRDRIYRRDGDQPLEIPSGAVVVPGTRPVRPGPGAAAGVALYAPVIVKYRDDKTDTAVRLESLLR